MARTGRPPHNVGACLVKGCDKPQHCRHYCKIHYRRLLTTGDPTGLKPKGPRPQPKPICSAPGCDKVSEHAGLCNIHYRRKQRTGQFHTTQASAGEPLEWLRAHCGHKGDDCLMWPFSKAPGYSSVSLPDGTYTKAHRKMCELAHGEPKPDMVARHLCGVPECVNPRHLAWGTPKENTEDIAFHAEHGVGPEAAQALGETLSIHYAEGRIK